MILELCDNSMSGSEVDVSRESLTYNKNLNPFECDDEASTTSRPRFSLSDMKFPNVKKMMKSKREKHTNGLCLKITTSKMRCSIKVKEEFENDAGRHEVGCIPFTSSLKIYLQPKFIWRQLSSNTTFSPTAGEAIRLRRRSRHAGITSTQPSQFRCRTKTAWTTFLSRRQLPRRPNSARRSFSARSTFVQMSTHVSTTGRQWWLRETLQCPAGTASNNESRCIQNMLSEVAVKFYVKTLTLKFAVSVAIGVKQFIDCGVYTTDMFFQNILWCFQEC